MRRARVALLVLLACAAAGTGWWWQARWGVRTPTNAAAATSAADDSVRAPAGVRVRVEVLNASSVRGLARRATVRLRDLGYDVVASGNAGEPRESTLVLVRTGDLEVGQRIARGMGGARVEARPDTSRYVDVSVLVGRTWRPPPGPFRP